jgi:hypothetical protein
MGKRAAAVALWALAASGRLWAQNDATRANSYDDAWESAWVAHCRSVYTTAGKTAGFVLQIGDSITHSNPYSQWPRGGAGQTAQDAAITSWTRAATWGSGNGDAGSKNGWYLAAADTNGGRGMTAASGLRADEFLSGSGNGSPAMPATTDPATARGYVSAADYGENLHVTTVAAAFSDAALAVVMLGTNDCSAGRTVTAFLNDLTAIVNTLEGRNIVVVLSTIPPHYANDSLAQSYNASIRSFAQTRGLPLIDFYAEVLARQPGTAWNGTLLNLNDVHPTASDGTYASASDPYTPGGNPATHTTGDACLTVGYLLRSWLTVQKLKEVKSYVADGNNPPGPAPAPPPGPAPAPAPGAAGDDDDDSACGCGSVGPAGRAGVAACLGLLALLRRRR